MTEKLLIRSEGDYFLVPDNNNQTRQLPKNNYRELSFESAEITEERTLDLSVSSNQAYERWGFYEVLEHNKSAVDLSRFNDHAIVLFNHNRDDYIGVIEKAWLKGGKLYNTIRFDDSDQAEKILRSVNNGVISHVSIGYRINELVLAKKSDDDLPTYKATAWTPFETSLVTVPADASVGVGRQYIDIKPNLEVKTPEWENLETRVDDVIKQVKTLVSGEKDMSGGNTSTIEVKEQDIRTQERERIASITAAGKKYDCIEIAEKAISDDMSVDQARTLMAEKVLGGNQEQSPIGKSINPVGMSNSERRKYSVIRAIGYAAGVVSADEVGLELEVSRALQERIGKAPKKIYLDQSEFVSHRAPYETGVPAAAGDLVETELLSDRFIEQLFNEAAVLPMGITYLRDLTGNIEIPREESYTNGYWVGEKNTIPEDEGSFGKIGLAPKKLAVLTKMTYEMIEQSSIDLERLVRSRLIRGLALELDRTIMFGSGIGFEPLGIVSHPEVKSIVLGANGGALNYAAAVDMQTELAAANAMNGNSCGYVINARTRGTAMKTLEHNTGSSDWLYKTSGTNTNRGIIAGYTANCSNQIPNNLVKGTANNLTASIFGDYSKVLLGIWSGMDVMANPYSEFGEAIIQIRAMQLVDHNLTRGDFFCVATDIQNN